MRDGGGTDGAYPSAGATFKSNAGNGEKQLWISCSAVVPLPPLRPSARPKPGACSERCSSVRRPLARHGPHHRSEPHGGGGGGSCSGFWGLKRPPWLRPSTPVFEAPALGASKGGRGQGFETEALTPKIRFLVLMPAACRPLMLEQEYHRPLPAVCQGLFLVFVFLFAKAKRILRFCTVSTCPDPRPLSGPSSTVSYSDLSFISS